MQVTYRIWVNASVMVYLAVYSKFHLYGLSRQCYGEFSCTPKLHWQTALHTCIAGFTWLSCTLRHAHCTCTGDHTLTNPNLSARILLVCFTLCGPLVTACIIATLFTSLHLTNAHRTHETTSIPQKAFAKDTKNKNTAQYLLFGT